MSANHVSAQHQAVQVYMDRPKFALVTMTVQSTKHHLSNTNFRVLYVLIFYIYTLCLPSTKLLLLQLSSIMKKQKEKELSG